MIILLYCFIILYDYDRDGLLLPEALGEEGDRRRVADAPAARLQQPLARHLLQVGDGQEVRRAQHLQRVQGILDDLSLAWTRAARDRPRWTPVPETRYAPSGCSGCRARLVYEGELQGGPERPARQRAAGEVHDAHAALREAPRGRRRGAGGHVRPERRRASQQAAALLHAQRVASPQAQLHGEARRGGLDLAEVVAPRALRRGTLGLLASAVAVIIYTYDESCNALRSYTNV